MDQNPSFVSPRKRVKLQHNLDGAMDDISDSDANEPTTAAPSALRDQETLQLDKEVLCGITELIHSDRQAFSGVLKKRYTDFLVNEILPSGLVVHLDDFKAPRAKKIDLPRAIPAESKPPVLEDSTSQLAQDSKRVLPEPDSVNRTKHTVLIRETDEGIEEIGRDEQAKSSESSLPSKDDSHESGNRLESGKHEQRPDIATGQKTEDSKKHVETSTTSDWNAYAGKPARFELLSEDREILTKYFTPDVVEEILSLYNRILHSPTRRAKDHGMVKSAVITDRTLRTKIHQDLRRIFQSRLESMTDNDGAMVICAMAQKPQWGSTQANGQKPVRRSQQNRRPQWQDLGGDYLHFTLYKENKDTMEAISWLSRQLKVPAKSFQFAGTKDRRGVTAQRVSVYRVLADRMIAAGRTLRQAKIGNYEYQPYQLRLGDLIGNEFFITLRDCRFPLSNGEDLQQTLREASLIVNASVNSLQQNGFINYYGLQRFGTFATRTDIVGLKMLQGDFKGAVDAILDFPSGLLEVAQDPESRDDKLSADDKARARAISQYKETGKSQSALEILPRKFSAESGIIRFLSGEGTKNDYQGALSTIPRNLRLMYVHAYQSLIWNVMAGLRWKEHGSKVIEGDLVLVREQSDNLDTDSKPAEVDADGEVVLQADEEDRATYTDDLFERARAVTKEEADSGKFTIFDIVLPTPGYDILYPANDMAEKYKSFMASERGGGLDPHNMRRSWKDASLSGSYRKILARPMGNITFEVKAYTDDDEQFAETDLNKMLKEGKYADRHRDSAPAKNGELDPEVKAEEKIAVILRLQLASSQYATMALRELMGPGGLQTYKPDYGGGR